MIKKLLPLLLAMALSMSACTQSATPVADLILENGKIYTVDPSNAWSESVAIKDGKILYVGTTEGANTYKANTTKVMDLAGKMAMPGINDLHVHPVSGMMVTLFECVFPSSYTAEQLTSRIKECADNNPDAD